MLKVSKRVVIAEELSKEDETFFDGLLTEICEMATRGRASLQREDLPSFINSTYILGAKCTMLNRRINELGTETFTANKDNEEGIV